MEAKWSTYRILMGNPEEEIPLGRPRFRQMDNIKTELRDIEWNVMGWTVLAQDRDYLQFLVKMVMNLRVS
jgi:histone acetyltransferase (RNA polymerase elongator complex component)